MHMCVCVLVDIINVCRMGEEARASHCRALPRVIFQQQPWLRLYGGAKKDKIDCFVLGRVAPFQFHGYSLCPFWSPISIFLCKAVSFSMIESILRLIVSVSMLTTFPTASIMTGSLVRLWTAVPVFLILR